MLLPDGEGVDDGDDDGLDEVLPLELESDGVVLVAPELLELEPVVVSVERDGFVPGDADGVRSAGRSPTRSVRDSLQPASAAAPRARAKTALSNFFI